MPELQFRLRWPDESETMNYSPSTIVKNFLTADTSYDLAEFVRLARLAMHAASARVQQTYGFPCSRAKATLAAIEQRAGAFAEQQGATVTVVELFP
jgi:uncharacterized repeat protein (TIGR04042 family)